ncbi:MAG: MFS transporter [Pseudomonadota bacterium]
MKRHFLQSVNSVLRPRGHVFFGWYIVGAAGGIQMLSGLLWMQSYGAYVVLLQQEFGWSKALVAGAFALTRIESGILGPLQGWLVDRYGPRAILRIGILVFGAGFILFSQIQSLLGFYLTFALIAVGSSLGGFATVMVSLVNWFSRHRAKAVAISQLGYSFGGLCVPIIILCLEAFGWRTTAFLSGLVVLVVGLPLVQVVRHRPSEIGELADGGNGSHAEGSATVEFDNSRDFTAREAMRTRAFWLISVGHAAALLVVSAVMVHLVPHLTEGLGYSLPQAGLVVALMTAFQMVGQLGGGYLGDRLNKQWICIACMVAHTLGLLLVAYGSHITMVLLFAMLHGLAWGTRGPLMVALRADYFGASSFGTIMGFSSLIVMLGMSTGPVLAGYMADLYGNYEFGFTVLAAGAFLGSFCFLAASPPPPPARPVKPV